MCNISVNGWVQLFEFYMYIPIFLLGLPFNILALCVFCWKFRKWTETSIYMTSLAVADMMVLLSIPFKMYSYKYTWNLGSGFCAFVECLYFVNMYVSIYIIVCICIDRYIAIKHPLNATRFRSPMKAMVACGVTWTFVFMIRIPLQIISMSIRGNQQKCFEKYHSAPASPWIVAVIEVIGFIIPASILSFCSFQIIMTLHKRKIESYGTTRFGRTIVIIATNLIIFFICYLPFHMGFFLQSMFKFLKQDCEMQNTAHAFVIVSIWLANLNCCLDAIVYYFSSVEVRDYLKSRKAYNTIFDLQLTTQAVQAHACSTTELDHDSKTLH